MREGKVSGYPWTDEQIEQLKTRWEGDDSTAEIARELGMSKSAVVGKAHRLGLPGRPSPILGALTDEERERRNQDQEMRRHARRYGGKTLPPFIDPALPEVPKPVIEPPPPRPAPRLVFSKITECCYPIGTPGNPGFRMCDAPTPSPRSPYCEAHRKIVYVKTTVTAEQVAGNMAITSGRVAVAR
jgi:GcrA cell cycle regulator